VKVYKQQWWEIGSRGDSSSRPTATNPSACTKIQLPISIIVLFSASHFSITFITIINGMDPEHEHVDQVRILY